MIQEGKYAAVIRFPAGFADALDRFRTTGRKSDSSDGSADDVERTGVEQTGTPPQLPSPELIYDAARDTSRIANGRIRRVLSLWQRAIVRQYLSDRHIPPTITDPFEIKDVDVSVEMSRRAAFWSKVLPFVVFIWALTGAVLSGS